MLKKISEKLTLQMKITKILRLVHFALTLQIKTIVQSTTFIKMFNNKSTKGDNNKYCKYVG